MQEIASSRTMLKNKKILVFGGDASLCDIMFTGYLENHANVWWINSVQEISNSNIDVNKIFFDNIHSIDTYDSSLNAIIEKLPVFDGIVFSLSIGTLRPLNLTKSIHLSKLFEINCMAFVELIRILNIKKKIREGSSILAYSSISSIMGLKTKIAYSISKAALNSAILNLAAELCTKKIRVNGILKGALTSDFNQEHVINMFSIGNDTSGSQDLGISTPEEIVNLSIFLLSDQVTTMTGTLIKLDGGYSLG